jgi:hypothetical protein
VAEEKATAIILRNMFMAALNLEGGGRALDSAVGDYIGPIPAPLAVLGGVGPGVFFGSWDRQ